MWRQLLEFLKTSGGTALVTVLLGGVLGNFISCSIQESLKERDFQNSWLEARGDQALEAYRKYLEGQQAAVMEVFELTGRMIAAAEDLINLTDPWFQLDNYKDEEKEKVKKQRLEIRERFNDVDREWRRRRETFGLLLSFYHKGSVQVQGAWKNVERALLSYTACARSAYRASQEGASELPGCTKRRDDLGSQLSKLNIELETNRRFAWEGWESPERLRKALTDSDRSQ